MCGHALAISLLIKSVFDPKRTIRGKAFTSGGDQHQIALRSAGARQTAAHRSPRSALEHLAIQYAAHLLTHGVASAARRRRCMWPMGRERPHPDVGMRSKAGERLNVCFRIADITLVTNRWARDGCLVQAPSAWNHFRNLRRQAQFSRKLGGRWVDAAKLIHCRL